MNHLSDKSVSVPVPTSHFGSFSGAADGLSGYADHARGTTGEAGYAAGPSSRKVAYDRSCSAPTLAAMLRVMGMALPHWADVLEDAANRLCGNAQRAKANRPSAHGVRTEFVLGTNGCALGGGKGEGVFDSEPYKAKKNPIPIQKGTIQTSNLKSQPEVRENGNDNSTNYVRTMSMSIPVSEIETVAKIKMNTRGETEGFLRFHAAYPPAEARLNLARYWLTQGLEAEVEAILVGLERWKASRRWKDDYVLGMSKWLENRMWEQAPPEPKENSGTRNGTGRARASDTRRADRAAKEFDEPDLLRDLEAVSSKPQLVSPGRGVSPGQPSTGAARTDGAGHERGPQVV